MCPSNQIRSDHVTQCEPTCSSLHHITTQPGSCDGPVWSGCKCPVGLVLHNQTCIEPDECPCLHNGEVYAPGATITRDCSTCVCERRTWTCTKNKCAATCSAIGDPHYETFDGLEYTFQGSCSYILASHIDGDFLVTAENVACGSTGVTCTKSVFVSIGPLVVHLLRGKQVTVNDMPIRVPKRYGIGRHTNSSHNALTEELVIDQAGVFIVVASVTRGLMVKWDGGTRVYVRVEPEQRMRMVGLCGNYNDIMADELTTQSGSVESNINLFADTWRVSAACPTTIVPIDHSPCDAHPERRPWAQRACNLILSNVFVRCHSVVDPTKYYQRCVHDSCGCDRGGDCECLCTSIAAYGTACTHAGVSIQWRSQANCPMQCDHGKVYKSCGNPCEKSCRYLDYPRGQHCSIIDCVEGCFCETGMIEHNGKCIKEEECPCFIDEGEFPPGTLLYKNCQNCTCQGGSFNCSGDKCELEPPCASDEFLCNNGQCIPNHWYCDGHHDCIDESDEMNCAQICNDELEYKCSNGLCIPRAFICDGQADCAGGDDETGCEGNILLQ